MAFIAIVVMILTVAQSIPQALKVFMSKFPRAISGFSVVFMLTGSLAWMLYGYSAGNYMVALAYSALSVLNIFILALTLLKAGVDRSRTLKLLLVFVVLLVLIQLYGKADYYGYLGGIISAFMVIPQGFKIIRQRETTGVSGLTYLLLSISSFSWIIYGHFTDNLLLTLPNLVIFPTAALVYLHILKYRHTSFFNSPLLSPGETFDASTAGNIDL